MRAADGAPPAHVAVIGAGIVGVSTALWLQREGVAVTIIDRKGPASGTSHGNAGVLASASVVPVTTPGLWKKAPGMALDPNKPLFLRWGYMPKLAPWLWKYMSHANAKETTRIGEALFKVVGDSLEVHQALAAGTPAERFIVPSPYTFAYADRAAYDADTFGWELRRKHGFEWEVLEGETVQDFDPLLGPKVGTLAVLPRHGHITDPGRYVKALAGHVVANGGRLVLGEVEGLVIENGRLAGVRVGGESVDADAAVLATGVWSGPLAKQLGLKVPLESERGYHLELVAPNRVPRAPTMVAAGKFVATPMDGRVRVAGIVEFGGLDAGPSRAPFALLKKAVKAAMPDLTWREEVEWMGHRPAPADSIPVIGAVPGAKGVWTGFGHHHIGLTAGPRTGQMLAGLIMGRRPNVDMSAFDPSRFHSATRSQIKMETVG